MVVNSTKSMTGTCWAARAVWSRCSPCWPMHHQVSPPTINIFNQDPAMRPGLLREHRAGDEDRRRAEELVRVRRNERHAGLQARLSGWRSVIASTKSALPALPPDIGSAATPAFALADAASARRVGFVGVAVASAVSVRRRAIGLVRWRRCRCTSPSLRRSRFARARYGRAAAGRVADRAGRLHVRGIERARLQYAGRSPVARSGAAGCSC